MPIRAHLALAFLAWLPRMPMSVRFSGILCGCQGSEQFRCSLRPNARSRHASSRLRFPPDGVSFRLSTKEGSREVAVNVQGFEQLKRVLSNVPQGKFNISN